MSIRAMQCFVAVVSAGSISRAAAALHVAQPALSLLIRNLEEDLGVVLLQRTTRRMSLTETGHAYYPWRSGRAPARQCAAVVRAEHAVAAAAAFPAAASAAAGGSRAQRSSGRPG
ncbi:hypothetical protein G6F32_015307 [Rhizopus arrhizus]|nr:hypothetical protein G6F32_015307 [Rhizopus arrhizus]